MKTLTLTRGYVALVDDDDYPLVSPHKWHATSPTAGGTVYAARNVRVDGKKRIQLMHRFILSLTESKILVDHENHIGTDNQRANLRLCNQRKNQANELKTVHPTSSRFKGVTWCKSQRGDKKWKAHIGINYKTKHLGYSSTEEEAAQVYDRAAQKHFKEFALTNGSD